MTYIPFTIGDVVSHQDLIAAYSVGNMGGMRKSVLFNSGSSD